MIVQAVTVSLPSLVYERLARRATLTHRTVEAEVVEAVMTSLPEEPGGLPADLVEAISALHLLDDEALWRAARTYLAPEKAADLEELHSKRQAEGLSASETEALTTLMNEYSPRASPSCSSPSAAARRSWPPRRHRCPHARSPTSLLPRRPRASHSKTSPSPSIAASGISRAP